MKIISKIKYAKSYGKNSQGFWALHNTNFRKTRNFTTAGISSSAMLLAR